MRILMLVFYFIIIFLGISFAALNAFTVHVNFYFTKVNLPMVILIIFVFGIGILLGCLLFIGRYWRLKHEYKQVKKQLDLTEKEIKNLRSIPLKS